MTEVIVPESVSNTIVAGWGERSPGRMACGARIVCDGICVFVQRDGL